MKGFITRGLAAVCVAGGLAATGGCELYRNLVDPCYPERYEAMARREVVSSMAPQVYNGHVLDQTVWNYHFEPGTDRLTAGGMDHLAYLARRRPYPDGTVFLQTAQDISYDQATPDKFAEHRASLDTKRIQAVQNYLGAQTAGRHLSFDVVVHDPADPGIAATPIGGDARAPLPVQGSVLRLYGGSQGNLPSSAGAGAASTQGGGGAGGSR